MTYRGREITESWHDEFQFDAALIPLMTESEQLRLGCHPTHILRDGEVQRRSNPQQSEEK